MNILIETFGIITTVLAVAGVVLNNRMDRKCFWFWILSNALSCNLHLYVGLWSLAVRDAVFLVLAIDGLRKWSNAARTIGVDIAKGKSRTVYQETDLSTGRSRELTVAEFKKLSPFDYQKIKTDFERRHTGPISSESLEPVLSVDVVEL